MYSYRICLNIKRSIWKIILKCNSFFLFFPFTSQKALRFAINCFKTFISAYSDYIYPLFSGSEVFVPRMPRASSAVNKTSARQLRFFPVPHGGVVLLSSARAFCFNLEVLVFFECALVSYSNLSILSLCSVLKMPCFVSVWESSRFWSRLLLAPRANSVTQCQLEIKLCVSNVKALLIIDVIIISDAYSWGVVNHPFLLFVFTDGSLVCSSRLRIWSPVLMHCW